MTIAFLALGTDLAAMSSRALSAWVRSLGHSSRIIFVPSHLSLRGYEPRTLAGIEELVRGCDLVGITVFTSQYRLAAQITEHLHATTRLPVLWGGIHAMIRPDECLRHADGICMGEGEPLLAQVVAGEPFDRITGLWYRTSPNHWVDNGTTPLVQEVGSLPFQDFSFHDHFWVDPATGDQGVMDREEYARRSCRSYTDLSGTFRVYYKTMASRGCPYACGYCNNSVMHALYTNRHFRRRSVAQLVEELTTVCRANPFIALIHLADDTFLNRSLREIREFATLYREQIGLPMRALTTPTGITDEKLTALLDAGLCHLYMGIESGSPQALARYRRPMTPARTLKAAGILHRHRQRMLPPKYDVICRDPLATPEETRENILFLTRIPRPRIFQYYTLGLFHGTHHRALVEAAGVPIAEDQPYDNDYFFGIDPDSLHHLLLLCLNLNLMPNALIRWLAQPWVYRWSVRSPLVNRAVLGLYRLLHGLESGDWRYGSLPWYALQVKRALTTGDWSRFRRYWRRLTRS